MVLNGKKTRCFFSKIENKAGYQLIICKLYLNSRKFKTIWLLGSQH